MVACLVFRKSSIIRSYLSSEYLSGYKISWSHDGRSKFCIRLSGVNVHFVMVDATRSHLQWRNILLNFKKVS
jgi:hypothetical protein